MRRFFPMLLLSLALPALAAACELQDDSNTPASSTTGGQQVSGDVPLHDARLDAARRARIEPIAVRLVFIEPAGWDGCLGIREPTQACTEQLIGGYYAVFRVDGIDHRYHFGGDRFVYADPAKQIVDATPLPSEIQPDLNRELARYVARDLELRLDEEAALVTAIIPVGFPDGCMGFLPEGEDVCDTVIVDGAVVFLLGPDGKTHRYHVGRNGVVATGFEKGSVTYEPNPAIRVAQQLMREDLARRLQVPVDRVAILSYRLVTWPDGCIGVYRPDAICAQALVQGVLAILTGPNGKEYRYHAGPLGDFIAAAFEQAARIGDPLPGRPQ